MGTTKTTATDGVPFIDITREFDAPRDVVWRAWTEPELVKQWLGPNRYEMVIDEYDVRDGGRYRYVHKDPDSGNEYGFHGVFHGTPSPDSFVQTFEFEGAPGHVSLEQLVLEDLGGGRTRRPHPLGLPVDRGPRRDGRVRHGDRPQRGLRAAGHAARDAQVARALNRPKQGDPMDWKLEVVVLPVTRRRPRQGLLRRAGRLPRGRRPGDGREPHRPDDAAGIRLLGDDRSRPERRRRRVRSRACSCASATSRPPAPSWSSRGVEVSPVRHVGPEGWADGNGGDWNAFIFFDDPDGNSWAVQESPTLRAELKASAASAS